MGNQTTKVLDSEVEDIKNEIPRISFDSNGSDPRGLSIDSARELKKDFINFKQNFDFLDEIQQIFELSGLKNVNLIFGLDYTFSNQVRGKNTFGRQNLHTVNEDVMNPYQNVILMIGKTLEKIDENSM